MFRKQIEIYNYPASFLASAEPRESGVRVMVEDNASSFMDIDKDFVTVSIEMSWDEYNRRGPSGVERLAEELSEKLFLNQIRNCKKLVKLV